jgi:hypothetical protein
MENPDPSADLLGTRQTPMRGWLLQGAETDQGNPTTREYTHPWYLVIWLTGVDYFSTLGYQPGIALLAAGILSPVATAILVLVTLACALPIYSQVAGRSFVGQGSIAMLENLVPGWWGKLFVLVLLGFAATDFVITMTLSAADAAQHAVENPLLRPYLGDAKILLTLFLLLCLALVFLQGFSEAIGLAAGVAIPYILLNVVVLGRCIQEIVVHPGLLVHWKTLLSARGDWTGIVLASSIVFPKLALGLSGFETGVSVMPLIAGKPSDSLDVPTGRIRNTRKLLITAAALMCVLLLISSFVTSLLISEQDYREGGAASGRAIAYLAHRLMSPIFASAYDLVTILILWFAGASAMAGLLNLVPRYLPRFGMAPAWVAYSRPLVILLFFINVALTIFFRANVEKQGGAYATGVLVLMLSAAIAAALALRKGVGRSLLRSTYCWVVSAVFAYTLVANVVERPDGVIIASIFITFILLVGAISRYRRATELRVIGLEFVDEQSEGLWRSITDHKVDLAPYTPGDSVQRSRVAKKIRENYKANGPFAFINVELLDNRSEFISPLRVRVERDCDNYLVGVSQAVATANAIAYLSEQLKPRSVFLELSRRNVTAQALRFLLLGEGEVGLQVYNILLRRWQTYSLDSEQRPNLFLMSTAQETDPRSTPTSF